MTVQHMRLLSRTDYALLKGATRELVDSLGGLAAAAGRTRVGKSQLSAYGALQEADFMPVDVAADLESALGQPVVSAALASLRGCDLVLRAGKAADRADPLALVSALSLEVAHVFDTLSSALSDNVIGAADARDIETQAFDVLHVVFRILDACAAAKSAGYR